jgi:saccharopine dehydrogenase-like NADP-dependent oxidoreductase
MKKILVLGAAGGVATVAASRILNAVDDVALTLADLHPDRVSPSLEGERTTKVRVDLFDREGLQRLVQQHELVLHGAGPYIRTAPPVARACLDANVAYVDFADDIEAFEAMLGIHDEARDAAVPLLMGCGVSPGLTNVFAADLVRKLDDLEVVDVAWASGDEGGGVMGRAVLEHVIHIAGGTAVRSRNGQLERFRSLTVPARFPMGGGLGDRVLWEIAHPEPVMLGRTYPNLPLIRCFGGIDPAGVMAVVRGIARAVHEEKISLDEAIRFMQATMGGKVVVSRAWRDALGGLASGFKDGMVSAREAMSFAGYSLLGRHVPFCGGILCRATGKQEGERKTLVLRSSRAGPGTFVDSMAGATGTCAAAFTLLALEGAVKPGLVFPEELDPNAVYGAFARLGQPVDTLMDDVLEVDVPAGLPGNGRGRSSY